MKKEKENKKEKKAEILVRNVKIVYKGWWLKREIVVVYLGLHDFASLFWSWF